MSKIREIRLRRAMTQTELAARAGLVQTTITRVETGKSRPTPTTVRRLAEALGVRPEELVEAGR